MILLLVWSAHHDSPSAPQPPSALPAPSPKPQIWRELAASSHRRNAPSHVKHASRAVACFTGEDAQLGFGARSGLPLLLGVGCVVDALAAEVGLKDLRVLDIEGVRIQDVLVHHDEVGRLTLFEAARLVFHFQGPGGVGGEAADHAAHVHALIGPQQVGRVVRVRDVGDAELPAVHEVARHAGLDALEGVRVCGDGVVGG